MSLLSGGFSDPAAQSARAFRQIMTAMARPGQIVTIEGGQGPAPLTPALATLALTLFDNTTPIHLAGAFDCPELRQWLSFHCGAPLVAAEQAQFALGLWHDLAPLSRFNHGDPAYPDRSATLIVAWETLENHGSCLRGPGIETEIALNLPQSPAFSANRALFPRGLDFIFAAHSHIAALPRSTRVTTTAEEIL